MATAIIMPRQGQSVESCIITSWNKKKGDKVNIGDILFSYETDKSSFDEVSTIDGTLLEIFTEDGEDVPCLETVCIIGDKGEDFSNLLPKKISDEKTVIVTNEAKKDEVAEVVQEKANIVTTPTGDIKISPRAKDLAKRTNADLFKVNPTGPHGRIIERDVNDLLDKGLTISSAALEAYLAGGQIIDGSGANGKVVLEDLIPKTSAMVAATLLSPVSVGSEYTDVKLTGIRKVIAKSMHMSLSTMAQLTLNSSFDATQIMEYRAMLKNNAQALGLENITLNDMVLFAVAKTLLNHKDLNAHYLDDTIRHFTNVNLGVAVDTERGLMVPTVFNANKLSLNELSKQTKSVISEAQKGTISPDKLKGGSFTVTNLGSLGVESFTPVINPPQTAILGVNNITRKIKEVAGKDVFYSAMALSLTFDHRAVDGAPAAKFLKELCSNLENFNLLMAK